MDVKAYRALNTAGISAPAARLAGRHGPPSRCVRLQGGARSRRVCLQFVRLVGYPV